MIATLLYVLTLVAIYFLADSWIKFRKMEVKKKYAHLQDELEASMALEGFIRSESEHDFRETAWTPRDDESKQDKE